MKLTLDQALHKGVEAHKVGNIQEADQYYTAILKAQPKHPDANHNMGVLAVGVGKVEAALPFFEAALQTNSNITQYWLSYLDALIKLDRMADAITVLEQAKNKGVNGDVFDEIELRLNTSLVEVKNQQQEDFPPPINILDELKLDQALMLASRKVKDGLNEEAKKIYRAILKRFPKNKKAIDELRILASKASANTSNMREPTDNKLQSIVKLYTHSHYDQALSHALQLLKQFPESFNLHIIIGAANKGLGKLDKAVEAYKKALSIMPNNPEAYYNMGNAFKEQGKLDQALEAYKKALSIKADYAEAYYNMGNALKEQGKLDQALEAYKTAISIKADYAEAYNNMGDPLEEQSRLEEAIEAYKKAISLKPNYAIAYNNMGNALQDQGKLNEAIQAFSKAISLKPEFAEAWSNGAAALERWNKLDQLELWLDKAFKSFEKVPADLRFIKSKMLWRNKNYEESSNLIKDIEFEEISEVRKQEYLHLKAKNLEKIKKFDEAYACFAQSNLLVKGSKEYPKHNAEQYFQDLRKNLNKLKSNSWINSKANSLENPQFLPTFLVGFPRSGTTLLDTVLRSNSKINVVEEKSVLSVAESFLRQNGYNDFSQQVITPHLILEAQKIYTIEFNKHLDTTPADRVYIDKLPLSLLKAPLIHQLYPNAKFILALRHPMDTILSCWMQNFKINSAMANMVHIDRIVDFYCIAMETFRLCRTRYNLKVHEIRYEDLINNFTNEAEAVLRFLNLDWEPEMINYQNTAFNRGRINTPSYSQVVQPIYKDAQYRWLKYRKYLDQYLEQVKPWISEFGYRHD